MYLHVFDRSDLDETVCYDIRAQVHRTRRQQLELRAFHRNDIVLMNDTNSGREYALYVTPSGYHGDMFLLDILSKEELLRVEVIARKMRQNAFDFPPARRLLVINDADPAHCYECMKRSDLMCDHHRGEAHVSTYASPLGIHAVMEEEHSNGR